MKSTFHTPAVILLFLAILGGSAAAAFAQRGDNPLETRVADLFENRCARSGCHAGPTPQMGLDLTPSQYYASVVGEPSMERPELMRVAPGQPEISYLVMKIHAAEGIIGTQMPLVGDELSAEEKQLVVDWVKSIESVDEERKAATAPSRAYPFAGTSVINLPTTVTLDRGSFFNIQHRFNPRVRSGYDTFFGIDGSGIILLTLGYAVTDEMLLTLGRSNSDDTVELQARYLLARQSTDGGAWPVDVGVTATMDWVTQDPPGDLDRLRSEAFSGAFQLTLARELPWGLGAALVPGVLFNSSVGEDDDALVTVGMGARWRFSGNHAVVAEWVHIADGYVRTRTFGNLNRWDTWGAGYEIATGGHVFQIVVSNSLGLTAAQYMRGGDLDPEMPDMRLGFNISRILNFW